MGFEQLFEEGLQFKQKALGDHAHIDKLNEAVMKFDAAVSEQENKLLTVLGEIDRQFIMAHKEHCLFEKETCLSLFDAINSGFSKAIVHNEQSKKHINNAIKLLTKFKNEKHLTEEHIVLIDNDLVTWKFFLEEANCKHYYLKYEQAIQKQDSGSALDNIRLAIKKLSSLKEYVEEHSEIIGIQFLRIVKGNILAMCSNEFVNLMDILQKNKSSLSETKIIQMIGSLWEAYNLSKFALKENPEGQYYVEVTDMQKARLKDLLKSFRNDWKTIYIEFEDQKEFLKIMKNIDTKKYNQLQAELYIKNNMGVKLWTVGSFMLLALVVIGSLLVLMANNIKNVWLVIPIFVTMQAAFIIVNSFILKSIDNLSEIGFIQLIQLAFKFQFLAFRKSGNNSNEE